MATSRKPEVSTRGSRLLKVWLFEHEMSQMQLSRIIGCTQRTIGSFVNEQYVPNLVTAIALEDVTGIPPRAWLLGAAGERAMAPMALRALQARKAS